MDNSLRILSNHISYNLMLQLPRLQIYSSYILIMNDKKIGSFRITSEQLGAGAFSKVYLGYTSQQQKVAVKVITRDQIKVTQEEQFISEVNLIRKCNDERIVKFIDVKKTKKNFYIFLEFCQGGNLAQYIQKKGSLDENEVLNIFLQLIQGLKVLKKNSITHRDIKPFNIMFKNGKVKYVDFGLATKYHQGNLMKTFAGSPLNMAPEVLKGTHYDDKVDIYSLGTVLYEMLEGTLPFKGRNITQLLENIEKRKYAKQVKVNTPLRKKLHEIATKMLQIQPEKRIGLSQLAFFGKQLDKDSFKNQLNQMKIMLKLPNISPYTFMFGGIAGPLSKLWFSQNQEIKYQEVERQKQQKFVTNNIKFIRQKANPLFDCQNSPRESKTKKCPSQLDLRISCGLYSKYMQKLSPSNKKENINLNKYFQQKFIYAN